MIDTHCHLASYLYEKEDVHSIIEQAQSAGLHKMITLGAHLSDWQRNVASAQQYPDIVYAALGIHPTDIVGGSQADDSAPWQQRLTQLHQSVGLCAIGETGLDHYHPPPQGIEEATYHALQEEYLHAHAQLAVELGLNIVIHTRDRKGSTSFDRAIAILREYASKVRPVFHCFIGTPKQAQRIFDELDALVSFTGVITFPNAQNVANTATWCPIDRIMLETDAPYLAPVPVRGQRNYPAHVSHVYQFLAQAKNIPLPELTATIRTNAHQFFKLN